MALMHYSKSLYSAQKLFQEKSDCECKKACKQLIANKFWKLANFVCFHVKNSKCARIWCMSLSSWDALKKPQKVDMLWPGKNLVLIHTIIWQGKNAIFSRKILKKYLQAFWPEIHEDCSVFCIEKKKKKSENFFYHKDR